MELKHTEESRREQRQEQHEEAFAVLGLVADPGFATKVADSIGAELPHLLSAWMTDDDPSGSWQVEISSQLLPLDDEGSLPLLNIGQRQREEQGWDKTIVLTELPRRAGSRPVVADCHPDSGVALVSLPAMGALRVTRQVRDAVLHLVVTYLWPADAPRPSSPPPPAPGPGTRPVSYEQAAASSQDGRAGDEARSVGRSEADEATEATEAGEATEGSVHLAMTGTRGRARLLTGMVRSNRPWQLVPSLSPALAGAAAGAAFGVFYSNIWQLAHACSVPRLMLVNAIAVIAMIVWLLLDNNLLEHPRNRRLRSESALYNAVTCVTISFGVVCMYVLLLLVTQLAAIVAIPTGYLTTTLGQAAGPGSLVTIAWFSASMGTIAGALGSGLAGEDAVRRAAYSARERERQAHRREEEERTDQEATPVEEDET